METLNTYHIETTQNGSFNFFTQSTSSKKALKRLLKHSHDFNNIVKSDEDFTITVKKIN